MEQADFGIVKWDDDSCRVQGQVALSLCSTHTAKRQRAKSLILSGTGLEMTRRCPAPLGEL